MRRMWTRHDPRIQRAGFNFQDGDLETKRLVILSEAESSRSELPAESKDPYSDVKRRLSWKLMYSPAIVKLLGVLRLRHCFAKRSSVSAQDDS